MKACILLGRGFEDVEAIYPYYRLQGAGMDTVLLSPGGGPVAGKNSITFDTIPVSEVDPSTVDVLVIPGGWAPDRLRIIPAAVEFVRAVAKTGAVIGAVCHGPHLLVEAGVVSGMRMTGWPSVATDLTNAGAIFEDAEVVIDHQFVTSRKPEDLPAFGEALVDQARQRQKKAEHSSQPSGISPHKGRGA